MLAAGAVPLLELEPYGIPLTAVTAGRDDGWLTRYARAVASLHAPVLLSFAPEANGSWYAWGYRHSPPAAFVAAWRHVVTLFRKAGAGNARWAWIVNYTSTVTEPLPALWPGSGYVDLVGLDGYLVNRAQTFASLFGLTIQSVRRLTDDPVLITETAASPAAGKLRAVTELTTGVAAYRLAGFVWFDISQHGALYHQDWQLEDDRAALAAFRAAAGAR
jgi:mannan endo-1,4-beta-mannosidase